MRERGMTAQEAISRYKRASILREFPAQFLNSSLDQIEQAAKDGDRAARTALKLLFSGEYDK
jgi:hypothetical protein